MRRISKGVLMVLVIVAVVGCAPTIVSNKEMIQVSYKGTLDDGSVFSQSGEGKPLEFLVGAGTIIPMLEKGMMGMKVGEKKSITVKAVDAYGEYDKTAVREVPMDQFPKDIALSVGQRYQVQSPAGPMVVTISAISGKMVTVDFNHPLAGKDLTFAVEILKIRAATKEELAAGLKAAPPVTQ